MFINRIVGRQRVFSRFLFSYIILVLITIMVSSIAYMEAFKIVEADARDRNKIMLKQSMDIIDHQLIQIDKITMQIALSQDIIDLARLNKPLKSADNLKFRNLIDNIQQYTINDNLLSAFYVYLNNSDCIITSETLYEPELFYKRAVRYDDMEYEYWKTSILKSEFNGEYLPARPANFSVSSLSEKKSKVITYIRSIPLDYQRKQEGNIVALINEESIQKLVAGVSQKEGSWTYIADARGNVISILGRENRDIEKYIISAADSGSIERSIDGQKYLITYVKSNHNNWMYVAVVPLKEVMENLNYIRNVSVFIILCASVVGMLAALLLSHRNSKPITNMFNMMKQFTGAEHEKGINEFQYINKSLSELINNNARLKDTMDKQRPLIRQAFFERLFKGEISNTNELNALLSHLDIKAEATKYLILIMHVYNEDLVISDEVARQLDIAKVFLKETISEYLAGKGLIYDIDEKKSALVLYFYNNDEQVCIDNTNMITSGIHNALLNTAGIKVYFSAGSFYGSFLELSKSFEEARQAYQYRGIDNDQYLYWFNDIKSPKNTFYYSVDIETRLFNCVKSGDLKEANKILDDIFYENVEVRKLSTYMTNYLVYQMRGTVIRLIGSLDIGFNIEEIADLDGSTTISEVFSILKGIYGRMCGAIEAQRKSRNHRLIDRIIQYINDEYTDSNLGLTSVAVQFGFTEGYLSHFFKDQLNENFLTYLENLRMNKACELLRNTNVSISDIALKVGYNSDQAFRRAFKRVKGASPTSYR